MQISGYAATAAAQAGAVQTQPSGDARRAAPTAAALSSERGGDALPVEPGDGAAALHCFASFLGALTQRDGDGRVILHPADTARSRGRQPADRPGAPAAEAVPRSGQLRFVLLNAAAQLGGLLTSARSVVLVSGG